MAAVIIEDTVLCRAPLEALWLGLGDTDRLNKAIGNSPVAFIAKNDNTATRFVASTKLGGFDVTYDERPYEWEYLKRFEVLRRLHEGPVSELNVVYSFEPAESGNTTVKVYMSLTPRNALLAPVVKLSAGRGLKRLCAEIKRIDDSIMNGEGLPRVPLTVTLDQEAMSRAEAALRPLAPPEIVDKVVHFIRDAGDFDVGRMRPFVLADTWGLDRLNVLRTFLYAVKSGMLELRWEVVCPSCRVGSDVLPTLSELKAHGGCQVCDIKFSVDFDETVEATFVPSQAIRMVDQARYCIGGPARTPHVLHQVIIGAGGTGRVTAPNKEGPYRLFARGGSACDITVFTDAPIDAVVDLASLGMPKRVRPGGSIVITNSSANEIHCKIEAGRWGAQSATARVVTSLKEFRRDFSSDVLKPGSTFKLSRMALLFSDLASSTQLYADSGDAQAYKVVQDHFELVQRCLDTHGGVLVKTIGDAVMAAFASEMDGVLAALDILRAFEPFLREDATRQKTHIKLGLYAGSCFAVTANNVLDYFGQTVNIAARLQGEAKSGQLVIPAELADDAISKGVITAAQVCERYNAELKGVSGALKVARVDLRA